MEELRALAKLKLSDTLIVSFVASGGPVYTIEYEQETDGRWIAELTQLPGVMAYGTTKDEAGKNVEVLALRVIADQLEHDATKPIEFSIASAA